MLQSGRLHELFTGGYAVGHRALDRRGLLTAAVTQAGRDNVAVSHISAARGWEMVPASREGAIHVSVRNRSDLVVPAGVELHRPRNLTDDEVTERFGFPITTPERTLLRDLLATSSVVEITRMLEQMVTVIGRSPDALHAWARTLPRVPGKSKLLAALDHIVGPAVLRSELEREFRSLCQTTGLLMPQTNVRLGRWEVDALYPLASLVIELDSYRFHGGRWQFNPRPQEGPRARCDGLRGDPPHLGAGEVRARGSQPAPRPDPEPATPQRLTPGSRAAANLGWIDADSRRPASPRRPARLAAADLGWVDANSRRPASPRRAARLAAADLGWVDADSRRPASPRRAARLAAANLGWVDANSRRRASPGRAARRPRRPARRPAA